MLSLFRHGLFRHGLFRHSLIGLAALAGIGSGAPVASAEPGGPADLPGGMAQGTGVALAYFRFDEPAFADSNVRTDQFADHLRLLAGSPRDVVPMEAFLRRLRRGDAEDAGETTGTGETDAPMPVAVTIDNAYASVYRVAYPMLREAGMPFAVFVATDLIDSGSPQYMTWDQLRELADAGVAIGLRGASHARLPRLDDLELRKDIRRSLFRAEQELGFRPTLFSYPYGETSNRVIEILAEHGFTAAFGQHSGAAGVTHPMLVLPRFPITEAFADEDRFRLAINAHPLDAVRRLPADYRLVKNPPEVAIEVRESMGELSGLACFATDQGELPITIDGRRVAVTVPAPFIPGRARINCTMPDAALRDTETGAEGWRWFGMQFFLDPESEAAFLPAEP